MERILVVDDEVETCNVLKDFLVLKGYEAHIALNGEDAIKMVKEVRPHIVLLDIMMPGMGGIEALKEIKKVDSRVGVVMITAVTDEEIAKRTLELGAYDYITKPMDIDYLETVLMVMIVDILS